MRVIIPMAGRGSRLRPHTLTVPKPLLPIAGKPIVQRLVEDLARIYDNPIDEIVFIIGDFGEQVEQDLLAIAERLGSKGRIAYQDKPLGTAHAIACAGDSLQDELLIAFADTLFRADFQLDRSKDGVIWVNQVQDPKAFGVVKLNDRNEITEMVEKPQEFVSDLAIIGIYYIKDGAALQREIQHLLDHDIRSKGEYQLTDALEALRSKGSVFLPGEVTDWMDCGNKQNVLDTNARVLGYVQAVETEVDPSAALTDTVIISPVKIGANVKLTRCVVGPHVSIGANSNLEGVVIQDSLIQENVTIQHAVIADSIISNHAQVPHTPHVLNLGDYAAG